MTSQHSAAVNPAALSVEEFLTQWGSAADVSEDAIVAAVLGRPIAHSRSPQLHSAAAVAAGLSDFDYVRIEAGEAAELRELISQSHDRVAGFSVTMPGKSAALEVADVCTERALRVGSANTLVRQHDNRWVADNTDVVGVLRCLEELSSQGVALSGSAAVIVGNGGTARPAVAALAECGVSHISVLARSAKALALQDLVESYGMSFAWIALDSAEMGVVCSEASALINTIPAHIAATYASAFTRAQGIVDVIYNPYPTPLMEAAGATSIPVADGLRMLAGQAEEQFLQFTGTRAPQGIMLKAAFAED